MAIPNRLLCLFVLAAALLCSGCTPAARTAAHTVARSALEAARILCLLSHAESLGVSPEQVAEEACDTADKVRPWVRHVLGAQKAGAADLGLAPRAP